MSYIWVQGTLDSLPDKLFSLQGTRSVSGRGSFFPVRVACYAGP